MATIDVAGLSARGLRVGSDEHKELFCGWFIRTHRSFDPAELPWPDLDDAALARLRAVPIWDEAIQIETKAGELVTGFAQTLRDPLVREAVAVQGVEETRHGQVLAAMARRYGLAVSGARMPVTIDERSFIDFAYKECIDAFVGFGAFRLAREAQFLPDAFLQTFVDFMAEETRHIVFFINWIAYERSRRGRGGPLLSAFASAIGYARALRLLVKTFKVANNDAGFMGGGDAFGDFTLRYVVQTCLRENDLQMAQFDPRLLRPRVIPALARLALPLVPNKAAFG